MNCKNCNHELAQEDNFCSFCGAKVIRDRITLKALMSDLFTNAFGWDNKFFLALRHLLICPEVPFSAYINGTRKQYINPFTFFAICATATVLILSTFSEQYFSLNSNLNQNQTEVIEDDNAETRSSNISSEINQEAKTRKFEIRQGEYNQAINDFTLKYFNLISFLMLPLYALIAFWVFRKPYNYAEHLVVNAYIQGLLFISMILAFIIGMFTNPTAYFIGISIFPVAYYSYAYARWYKQSFGKAILSLLKFILIGTAVALVVGTIVLLIGILVGIMMKS